MAHVKVLAEMPLDSVSAQHSECFGFWTRSFDRGRSNKHMCRHQLVQVTRALCGVLSFKR